MRLFEVDHASFAFPPLGLKIDEYRQQQGDVRVGPVGVVRGVGVLPCELEEPLEIILVVPAEQPPEILPVVLRRTEVVAVGWIHPAHRQATPSILNASAARMASLSSTVPQISTQ